MPDFPSLYVPPHSITPFSFTEGLGKEFSSFADASALMGSLASATVIQNQAYYYPLFLPLPVMLKRFFWCNGATVAGNLDIAVYNYNLDKIIGAGATAQATINALQFVDVTDTLIPAGRCWLGIASNSTTATFLRTVIVSALLMNILRALGMAIQASAYSAGLPAAATFASAAGAGQQIIFCGFEIGKVT
mgnify:CR=1 FL=1